MDGLARKIENRLQLLDNTVRIVRINGNIDYQIYLGPPNDVNVPGNGSACTFAFFDSDLLQLAEGTLMGEFEEQKTEAFTPPPGDRVKNNSRPAQ